MSVEIDDKNTGYKKPGFFRVAAGALAGSSLSGIPLMPHRLISPKLMDNMKKISDSLTNDEFTSLQTGITKAFDKSGLAKKGISILKAGEENSNEIAEAMGTQFNKGLLKLLPKVFKDNIIDNSASMIAEGENACYVSAAKKVIVPDGKLNLAVFHEAGHALNDNMSMFGKVLQKSRYLSMLMIPIMLIALFKNKKAEGEEPKNGFDKATDFVKDNAGKLAFLSFVPTLLEEGLASIKGNKMAHEFLNADLAKKVAKTNLCGFGTYALLAAGAGFSVYLAKKVRDSIVHKNQKNALKNGFEKGAELINKQKDNNTQKVSA